MKTPYDHTKTECEAAEEYCRDEHKARLTWQVCQRLSEEESVRYIDNELRTAFLDGLAWARENA